MSFDKLLNKFCLFCLEVKKSQSSFSLSSWFDAKALLRNLWELRYANFFLFTSVHRTTIKRSDFKQHVRFKFGQLLNETVSLNCLRVNC